MDSAVETTVTGATGDESNADNSTNSNGDAPAETPDEDLSSGDGAEKIPDTNEVDDAEKTPGADDVEDEEKDTADDAEKTPGADDVEDEEKDTADDAEKTPDVNDVEDEEKDTADDAEKTPDADDADDAEKDTADNEDESKTDDGPEEDGNDAVVSIMSADEPAPIAIVDWCDHPSYALETQEINVVDVIYSGADGHILLMQEVKGAYCEECGCYLPDYSVSELKETGLEKHQFDSSGCCRICEYWCQHPESACTYETKTETEYEYISKTEHYEIPVERQYLRHCDVCGADYTPDYDEGYYYASYSYDDAKVRTHTYDEFGYCKCGDKKDEEHHFEEFEAKYPTNATPVDEIYHQYTSYYSDKYNRCVDEDCGLVVPSNFEEVTLASPVREMHSFIGDECRECGYIRDNSCKHTNRVVTSAETDDQIIWDKTNAIANGDGTHKVPMLKRIYYVCADCGYEFHTPELQIVYTTDDCDYYDPDTGEDTDKCVMCGAPKPEKVVPADVCYHASSLYEIVNSEDFTIIGSPVFVRPNGYGVADENVGEGTHTFTWGDVRVTYLCKRCGETVTGSFYYGSYMSGLGDLVPESALTGAHVYDTDGWCVYCDASEPEEECEHLHLKYDASDEASVKMTFCERKDKNVHTVVKKVAAVCEDCGTMFDIYKLDRSTTEAHVPDSTGTCTLCGETGVCDHPDLASGKDAEPKVSYASIDDLKHNKIVTAGKICPKCKQTIYGTPTTTAEEHNYKDGKCVDCGHICKHTQVDMTKPADDTKKTYSDKSDASHTVTVVETRKCACGGTKETTYDPAKVTHTPDMFEEKSGAMVCKECGYTCTHSKTTPTGEPVFSDKQILADDDATHSEASTKTTPWKCDYCGFAGETVEKNVTGKPEAHKYEKQTAADGSVSYYCATCKHTCAHDGVKPVVDEKVTYPEEEKTNEGHKALTTTTTTQSCAHHETIVTVETKLGEIEKHSYVDGVCTVCGHKCTHPKTVEELKENPPTESDVTYVNDEDNHLEHTVKFTKTTTYSCPFCEQVVESATKVEKDQTRQEKHAYDAEGLCAKCGHQCDHSVYYLSEDEKINIKYTSNGASGHTVTYDLADIERCIFCEKALSEPVVTKAGVTEVEAHSFSGRTCTLCGYTKPAPAKTEPTQQETVSDEPVFEAVASGTTVHGVTVGDGSRMATTLVKAVQGLQGEYGADVSITVQNAGKIFSAADYDALCKLPAQEQVFVVLMTLGYEDEVYTGMNELGILLSQEAEDLIRSAYERLTAMSEAEFAAYQAEVGKYFPLESGAHVQITLEIRVKTESGYRMERYGFELKDGAWVFAKLEVAGAE